MVSDSQMTEHWKSTGQVPSAQPAPEPHAAELRGLRVSVPALAPLLREPHGVRVTMHCFSLHTSHLLGLAVGLLLLIVSPLFPSPESEPRKGRDLCMFRLSLDRASRVAL